MLQFDYVRFFLIFFKFNTDWEVSWHFSSIVVCKRITCLSVAWERCFHLRTSTCIVSGWVINSDYDDDDDDDDDDDEEEEEEED